VGLCLLSLESRAESLNRTRAESDIGSIAGGPRLLPVEIKRHHIQDTRSTRGRGFVCRDRILFPLALRLQFKFTSVPNFGHSIV
jgi:hypothetical protein